MVHMRSSNLVVHAWAIVHTGLPTYTSLMEEIVVDGFSNTACLIEHQKIA